MSARLVAWIVGALALYVVLSFVVPGLVALLVFPLAVLIAVVVRLLAGRHERGERDTAQALLWAAAALGGDQTSPNGAEVDWGAALRAELASITVPRERRRFAIGAALALLGAPHRLRSGLLAVGLAVAFAVGLLGFSRATVGHDGLGSASVLLPPVMLFALSFVCARSTKSLRFGVETGILAVLLMLVAVAVVFGVEAARWFDAAHVSILDGEYVRVETARAAVLDALHPVILLVHLLFWLPWPVLGAIVGVRARRQASPARTPRR